LRVLFSTPGYWPSVAFGGPVVQTRELARALGERGHSLEVVTTSLVTLSDRPAPSTRVEVVDGAAVHYLGTPLRYRWMGFTPTIRRELSRLSRPDVVHVFGFRDMVGTETARWAVRERIPYVFEGMGMVEPKLRKQRLKRLLDATVYRGITDRAALCVAASNRERRELLGAGISEERAAIRPIGFPSLAPLSARPGPLRQLLGIDDATPLVLSFGRVAPGKGIDLIVRSLPELPRVELAVVGPDDRGTSASLRRLAKSLGVAERFHLTGAWPSGSDSREVYADADVFVLASADESFGMTAAEAAAAGTVPVVTDRCGIAELIDESSGVVVPYDDGALAEAIAALLADPARRARLALGARALAERWSWNHVAEVQEALYERAVRRE
jgi:glycosyltransferase involved in cell wall biosynthesis